MDVATWQARGEWVPVAAKGPPRKLFVVHEGPVGAPDLVLLHGFPTSSFDWVRIWPTLVTRFRCLALDFLGFGFSEKPRPHRYSILEQADLVEALLDQREIRDVHLLAHDYGDSVAQELLAREVERADDGRRLRSACLLNGGLFPETYRPRFVQRLLRTPAVGPLLARLFARHSFYTSFPRIFGPQSRPSGEELDEMWSIIATHDGPRVIPAISAYHQERRRHRTRWGQALLEAPVPIQLVNGSRDPVSGAHVVERFLQLGGLAAIEPLAEIGHYPQLEAPERVSNAFLEWHDALAAGM